MADVNHFVPNVGTDVYQKWVDQLDGTWAPKMAIASVGGAIPVTVSGNTTAVSDVNSTTANLGSGATFTGTSVDTIQYGSVTVSVFSSHASATNGLSLEQSPDGTNWDIVDTYTVSATQAKTIQIPCQERYFRMRYVNGGTLTTSLRIQTLLNPEMPRASSVRPADGSTIENDFDQVLSVGYTYNGTTLDILRGAINGTNSTGTGIAASAIIAQFDDASVTAITENSFGHARMSSDHIMYAAAAPTTSVGAGVTRAATTVAAATLVAKASAGNLYEFEAYNGSGAAAYLMIFDATAAPADGTVTPARVFYMANTSSIGFTWPTPLRMGTGISFAMSSTGPYTKTAIATNVFISAGYM